MNRRQAENYAWLHSTLEGLGFTYDEVNAIIRIEKTLHRWCELDCGDCGGCIERDKATGKAMWRAASSGRRWPIADRENGALCRLRKIIEARNERESARGGEAYPRVSFFYQTDPRGCALYIIRPGDVVEGSIVESCYSRGIAVCY